MSSTEGISVEQLIEKLQEMIEKKPIVKKMTICLAAAHVGIQELSEVSTERERDGKPVRPFILLR